MASGSCSLCTQGSHHAFHGHCYSSRSQPYAGGGGQGEGQWSHSPTPHTHTQTSHTFTGIHRPQWCTWYTSLMCLHPTLSCTFIKKVTEISHSLLVWALTWRLHAKLTLISRTEHKTAEWAESLQCTVCNTPQQSPTVPSGLPCYRHQPGPPARGHQVQSGPQVSSMLQSPWGQDAPRTVTMVVGRSCHLENNHYHHHGCRHHFWHTPCIILH